MKFIRLLAERSSIDEICYRQKLFNTNLIGDRCILCIFAKSEDKRCEGVLTPNKYE